MEGWVPVLDPRTKLILAVFFAAATAVLEPVRLVGAAWAILILTLSILGFLKAYGRWLMLVLPMAVIFGGVTAWSVHAAAGMMAALKLLTLTTVFFIFFSTTPAEDLANALVKAGLPYGIAFIMSTALQFVPVIGRKAGDVLDAQRSRGIPVEPGWGALKHYPAFFIPLLLQSFQLAEELAEAMEARGFGRPGRTFLAEYRLKAADWIALGVSGIALAGFLFWKLSR